MNASIERYDRPNDIRPKRILLVGPSTKESIFSSRWVTAHQGIHWWASRLNAHGHYAAVYDMNLPPGGLEFEEIIGRGLPGIDDSREWLPIKDLHDSRIHNCNIQWRPWDIIGFSVLDATIEYDMAGIISAKKLASQALLIAGGSQATLNYQTLFDKTPLDIVVLGQDPFALLRIANEENINLFNPKSVSGIVVRNYAKPPVGEEWSEWIGELNFKVMHQEKYWEKTASLFDSPDFSEINTFRLFTHNFCPMNCAFCTLTDQQKNATGGLVKPMGLSGSEIVRTMQRVMECYPETKQFFFCDDDLFLTSRWEEDLNNSIIAAKESGGLPSGLRFICLTNINRLNEQVVERCARAGFRVISIGVESVSQWKLNSMNKAQTPEQIWRVTDLMLKYGIKPYYTLLIHTPFERPDDMVIDINGFRRMSEIGVGLSIEPYLMPLHGTIFHEVDIPTRYKMIPIEGSNETLKKAAVWFPVRIDSRSIFFKFEEYFPRFKKWRYSSEKENRHKEKNFYSHVILDAQEFILKHFFPEVLSELSARGIKIESPSFSDNYDLAGLRRLLDGMGDCDIDSIGSVIERKTVVDMSKIDFSHGRVNVRELLRKMANDANPKEKSKKEKNVEGSFH